MSREAQRDSHPEEQPADQPTTSFASLPEAVVAHIAHLSKTPCGCHGHPLLQVSSSCTDAVYSSCTSLVGNIDTTTKQEAEVSARFLHRACCQAPSGLQLQLRISSYLPRLLEHGLGSGGWRNVRKLTVGVQKGLVRGSSRNLT
jgi:hypothetical protein